MKTRRIDGARVRAALFGVVIGIGAIALTANGTTSADLVAQARGVHSSSSFGGAGSNSILGGGTHAARGVAATAGASGQTSSSPAHAGGVTGLAQGSTAGASGSVLRRFAPLYMGGSQHFTQAQAVTIAHEFDVVAEHSGVLTPYVSAMKAANPAFKVVGYMNGAFDQSAGGTSYPASWYAHDTRGNRIRSVMFGNWLMDPTNASWGSTVAHQCASLITQSKYDGCFLDTLGPGPLLPGYVTSPPVDQSTHRVFTLAAWIKAQSGTVSAVKRADTGAMTIANGLASGNKYFAGSGATEPLLAASSVAMSEIWLRVSRNSVNAYPSVSEWVQDVNMLVNAESHGWSVMTTTKLWTNATSAQQLAWHKFTLATFLLGAGGHCAYSFSTASTVAALSATSSLDTVAIGNPTGAYTVHSGSYQRQFTNGLVVVNPGNGTVNLTFPSAYRNLNGSLIRSETLAPHSGDVLVG